MALVEISKPASAGTWPFLAMGFRPFFLGAALFSVFSISCWFFLYAFGYFPKVDPLPALTWHAHEMIYGYAVGVVAGFLLTAVANWTGIRTLSGVHLGLLFCCWLAARLSLTFGLIEYGIILDGLFNLSLMISLAVPIIRVRQYRQIGILSKLALLGIGQVLFYLGLSGVLTDGIRLSLYGGLYLIVSLILTIAGRVMPAFIRSGLNLNSDVVVPRFIMPGTLILFLVFLLNSLFIRQQQGSIVLSASLFVLTFIRLFYWYRPGIWTKPLLWSLYLGVSFIALGFLLQCAADLGLISPILATHAFAYGGIGLSTIGMMSRVILGHTGRSIHNPPKELRIIFGVLLFGALVRVVFPLFLSPFYLQLIIASQLLWLTSFLLFLITFWSMLVQPRIDGQIG